MGFARDLAKVGLASPAALLFKKNKPVKPQPTMISNTPYERPMSMIGSGRGGY